MQVQEKHSTSLQRKLRFSTLVSMKIIKWKRSFPFGRVIFFRISAGKPPDVPFSWLFSLISASDVADPSSREELERRSRIMGIEEVDVAGPEQHFDYKSRRGRREDWLTDWLTDHWDFYTAPKKDQTRKRFEQKEVVQDQPSRQTDRQTARPQITMVSRKEF